MIARIVYLVRVSIVLALSVLLALPALAAPDRVALVIGNSAYRNAAGLANPTNDAADVAQVLRRIGFDVIEGRDLDKRAMEAKILEFGRKLDAANIALFFYAGHGMQVGGKNYLVPTDAKLERAGNLNFEAIDVALVLAQMEAEKRVNLVFLDACRDNPLARSFARSLGASRSAAVGRGLASIQSAVGTMIAYATQPDNVALDGTGRNSPFTTALLKHVTTPGLEIRSMMTRVRADVLAATREKQLPWDHSSLIGEVVLVPGALAAPAPNSTPAADEITWGFLKDTKDAEQLRRFVEQFPLSARRAAAVARLLEIDGAKVAASLPLPEIASAPNATPPAASPSPGRKRIVVNFDALNAHGQASGVGDKQLTDYLARFGIKLVASTAQRIAAFDERNIYAGKAVKASSGRGVLMQQGGSPVSYTLEFAAPLKSISFDRVALIAGPSGITHPTWTAVALDGAGKVVASVAENEIRSYANVQAKTFTLAANGIRRLVVTGDHRGFAAFSSLVLDNLVLLSQ
ncbi:MAG: caspase family protein [Proteobacteria bacterium]|nr:caspase family protein [Pseudomonadota bacterium]